MNRLELTDEETELLLQILRSHEETLDYELSRADSIDFKSMLRRRRELLAHLIERCATPAVLAA